MVAITRIDNSHKKMRTAQHCIICFFLMHNIWVQNIQTHEKKKFTQFSLSNHKDWKKIVMQMIRKKVENQLDNLTFNH
jgi:hypothetical protein